MYWLCVDSGRGGVDTRGAGSVPRMIDWSRASVNCATTRFQNATERTVRLRAARARASETGGES